MKRLRPRRPALRPRSRITRPEPGWWLRPAFLLLGLLLGAAITAKHQAPAPAAMGDPAATVLPAAD